MPKCPSEVCGYNNHKESHYCSGCGIDLSLSKEEQEFRDTVNSALRKDMDKEIPRLVTDRWLEKNVLMVAMAISKFALELHKKKTKEASLLDLEKEKIRILKEIRDRLPAHTKQKGIQRREPKT